MMRMSLVAVLAFGLLAVPGANARLQEQLPKAALQADMIVTLLHTAKVSYEKDLQTTPFKEVIEDLAKRYGIIFVVNKTTIGDMANTLDTAKAEKLSVSSLDGMLLGTFLNVYFRGLPVPDITYLVRADHIEITSREAAQQESGLSEAIEEAKAGGDPGELVRAKARLNLPLVCLAVKERPLSAVFNDLSKVYGLNIVVEPGGGGAREILKAPLTERLLNVPADTALEVLAGPAGLIVVRKGNTFRITQGAAQ